MKIIFFILCTLLFSFVVADDLAAFKQAFAGSLAYSPDIPDPSQFNETYEEYIPRKFAACPVIPVPPDTSNVKFLKPGNIKVVLAMGDSITAAMSAKDNNILNLKEYRGLSFSIGGDPNVITLPNLLHPYTYPGYPFGFATGTGTRTGAGTGLDGAVSGAHNLDMLSQAQWLVNALKARTQIDYQKDWKVLTIWIGSNNLCVVCNDAPNNDAANFEKELTVSLDYLYTNVPRLFVNLIANMDVTSLYQFKAGACLLHGYECSCGGATDAKKRALVTTATKAYRETAFKLALKYNQRNSTQFAVVVQPFLTNTNIPDRSYLSPADCFHPSAKGHEALSIAVWNNMLVPAASKKTYWDVNDVPLCAGPDTLLYTN